MRRALVLLLQAKVLLAAGAVGCGRPPNSLDGSIGASVDLQFDQTQLRKLTGQDRIQLDYLREIEGATFPEVVAKIVVGVPEGGFVAGEEVALQPGSDVVERSVAQGDAFPDLERGQIVFDEGGNAAGPAKGSFAATFVNGKTLNGTFDVEMTEVDF